MATNPLPHIVIFGGGFAGVKAFDQLGTILKPTEAEITLVNQWPFLYYNIAVPRALVDPVTTPVEKLMYPLKNLCKAPHQRVVIGSIHEIHSQHALISRATESTGTSDWYTHLNKAYLQDSTTESFKLKFDYAVIAIGSQYPFPGKLPPDISQQELISKFKLLQENIQRAKKIVILGTGPVGLETAGEIKTDFPDKSVTLLGPKLFSLNPTFLKKLEAVLKKKQVQTMLNVRAHLDQVLEKTNATSFPVCLHAPVAVQLDAQTSFEADVVLQMTGVSPVAPVVKIPNAMDDKGWVKVNAQLQVEGEKKVFAIGDAAASGCGKFAWVAMQQADHVSQSLAKFIKGKPGVEIQPKSFTIPPALCVLALGRDDGVSQIPLFGTFLGSKFAKMFKGDGGFMTAKRFLGPSLMQSSATPSN